MMLAEADIIERFTSHAAAEKRTYYGIDWATYSDLRDQLDADESRLRVTYDKGILEVMSPKAQHEKITHLVDTVITHIAFATDTPLLNCGSLTMRLKNVGRGGEPDSCYYVAHEAAVRGVDDINLEVDPPPDVVLETDVTNPSLDKMMLYAAARVPEVWRYEQQRFEFYALSPTGYTAITHSLSFPILSSAMLNRLILIGNAENSNAMLKTLYAELLK